MNGTLFAVGMSASGAVAAAVTAIAQASGEAGSHIAPYVTSGGSAVSVAALAYVVKKFLAGDIVAKPLAEHIREQSVMLTAMGDREDKAIHLAEQVIEISRNQAKQQEATNRLLWRLDDHLGGTDERRPRRPR